MMVKIKTMAAALVLAALIFGVSMPVAAQQGEELALPGVPVLGDALWSTSTTTTSTTMAVALGMYSLQLARGSDDERVQIYLRDNAVAVQQDLHLGGGETTADLASIFGVSAQDEEAFAQVLFEQRKRLAPLVELGKIDAARAQKFSQIIVDSI